VNLAPEPAVLVSVLEQDIYYKVGVLVDLACSNSRDALEKVSYSLLSATGVYYERATRSRQNWMGGTAE
jgi:hypothetical protein